MSSPEPKSSAEILSDAFSVIEDQGDRVQEAHMSGGVFKELVLAGLCDHSNLWGARPVLVPCDREVTLVGESGLTHKVTL